MTSGGDQFESIFEGGEEADRREVGSVTVESERISRDTLILNRRHRVSNQRPNN